MDIRGRMVGWTKRETDCMRVYYFGIARPIDKYKDAWKRAEELLDSYEYVEYGISHCKYNRPLDWLAFIDECLCGCSAFWGFEEFSTLLHDAFKNNALEAIITDLNYLKPRQSNNHNVELIDYTLVCCDAVMTNAELPKFKQ